jgi:hypothetical protein
MRHLRLALIPSLACVLSCSTTTEERLTTQPNPVQPVLGNPVLFPSLTGSPIVEATSTPTPRPPTATPVAPGPTATPAAPNPTATPAAPNPTATPTKPSPTATPTAPNPTATPTSAPPPGAGSIHHIRVGFFGISCKNGKAVPNNGAKQLPVGCKGFVTATPKKANGDDVPLSEHGPDIDWELEFGGQDVEVRAPSFPSDFNKDLVGLRVGTFNLCATVRGVTGCLDGTVTP